jgi:NADPH-dependent ferric siderophore reductase
MSTDAPSREATAFRLFPVEVRRAERLGPSFVRFTFTGDDLDRFADNGYDQRIKLVLPLPGVGCSTMPAGEDWYARWRTLPDEHRNPIRTYTVRAVRRHLREVDVDMVVHGEVGPASRWATHAAPGDEAMLLGPNADFEGDHGGVEFPASAWSRPLLIAGDETAVPAIASILERLPAAARGEVVLEVPAAGDVLDLVAPPGVTITWLARAGAVYGERLVPVVQATAERLLGAADPVGAVLDDDGESPGADEEPIWEVPEPDEVPAPATDGGVYAWLAGEAGAITTLRRHLVRELGVDRRSVAFMGYWKLGYAEC